MTFYQTTTGLLLAGAIFFMQACYASQKGQTDDSESSNRDSDTSTNATENVTQMPSVTDLPPDVILKTNECNHVVFDNLQENGNIYQPLQMDNALLQIEALPTEYIDDPRLIITDLKCQEGAWLATTSQNAIDKTPENAPVPLSNGDMIITFDSPLAPPVTFAATLGIGAGESITISLLNEAGKTITQGTFKEAPILYQNCDDPNIPQPFSPTTVGIHATLPVKQVLLSNSNLKEFFFASTDIAGETVCPWEADGTIPDSHTRCDIANTTKVSFTCVPKPSDVLSCGEITVDKMNEVLRQQQVQNPDLCIANVRSLLCGPNDDEIDNCCYFADIEEQLLCMN